MKSNIKKENIHDLIIIGSGPGGMAAAIYAARAMIDVLIIEKEAPGGKMIKTQEIENYPGYEKVLGPDLSMAMFNQIDSLNKVEDIKIVHENNYVTKIEVSGIWKILYDRESKPKWKAKAVIIATGTLERKIGVPGEEELYGRGVSYCAVCDGAFFTGQDIAVVGGGNAAFEEALYLTKYAKKLYLIHRRQEFRANKDFVAQVLKNKKIKLVLDTVVTKINGVKDNEENQEDNKVDSIVIKNVISDKEKILNVKAIFPYIGAIPNSEMVKDLNITDGNNYIITNEKMKTAIDGIYAVGDVRTGVLKQISTAVGDGAIAGQSVVAHIDTLKE